MSSATPTPSFTGSPLYVDDNESCVAGNPYQPTSQLGLPGTFSCNNADYNQNIATATGTVGPNGDNYELNDQLQVSESSNASGQSPTSNAAFYAGSPNTSSFSVQGTAIASTQFTINDTPNPLAFSTGGGWSQSFTFIIEKGPTQVSTYTQYFYCTVFDNGVQIGSGTGMGLNSSSGGTYSEDEVCDLYSQNETPQMSMGTSAAVNLTNVNTLNIGDVYTVIISQ